MNRLGIEYLSIFGLPPVQFVELAADLGCANISLSANPIDYKHHSHERYSNYPKYSLKDDPALRRETMAAMRDRGVSISLGEGFVIRPGIDITEQVRGLEAMCELGVKRFNSVSMDPDVGRSFDQFAKFAEMADAAAADATIELSPNLTICNLPMALDVIRHVGRSNFKLLIDTMHFVRSGSGAKDIAAIDPKLIGYVQVCDVPLKPTIPDYMEEAMLARMPPGEGELPLLDILSVLPRHLVLSVETPMRREADAGIGHHQRLSRSLDGLRALLAQLEN